MIKKRGFWRNTFFCRGKTGRMLTYLNRMSAKGLHVTRLGRFKNTFDDDSDRRYLYAVCSPATEDYYSEVGRWERLFEYKSLVFYRKKFPKDYVGIKKRNLQKKAMKEKLWLSEMLRDGLLLFGKAEDEYIFEHSRETDKTEYFVDYIPADKNPDEYLYEKALIGLECISPSTDGITYYFIRKEGKEVVKGLKKIRSDKQIMKKRMLLSLLSCFLITAAFITALTLCVIYQTLILPCLITGGVLTGASAIAFLVFKNRYNREKLRLFKEEAALEEFKGISTHYGEDSEKSDENGDKHSSGGNQTPTATQSQSGIQFPPQNGALPQSGSQYLQQNGALPQSGSQYPRQNVFPPQAGTPPFFTQPLPAKSDDSDQWQYVDESEDEYEDGEEENNDQGITYSPGNASLSQKPYSANGQSHVPYGTGGQSPTFYGIQPPPDSQTHPSGVQYGADAQGYDRYGYPISGHSGSTYPPISDVESEKERISAVETEYERGRFLIYQLISGIAFLLIYLAGAVLSVINCVFWFIPEKRGPTALFILGILLVVFLPVVIYSGIGSARVMIRDIKSRKNKGF